MHPGVGRCIRVGDVGDHVERHRRGYGLCQQCDLHVQRRSDLQLHRAELDRHHRMCGQLDLQRRMQRGQLHHQLQRRRDVHDELSGVFLQRCLRRDGEMPDHLQLVGLLLHRIELPR